MTQVISGGGGGDGIALCVCVCTYIRIYKIIIYYVHIYIWKTQLTGKYYKRPNCTSQPQPHRTRHHWVCKFIDSSHTPGRGVGQRRRRRARRSIWDQENHFRSTLAFISAVDRLLWRFFWLRLLPGFWFFASIYYFSSVLLLFGMR